jgi:predicted extracellular nuclease
MFFALTFLSGQVTSIHDIQYTTDQGSGSDCYPSTLVGQTVTVSGLVTGVQSSGRFYLQDAAGAWNGIYVFDTSLQPSRGDSVTFTATISEYYGLTELSDVSDSTIHSSGHTLYAPIDISTGDLSGGCSDTAEPYEGLLVRLTNVTVTAAPNQYGEWYVDDGSGACQVDDQFFSVTPSVGDFFSSIVGLVDYGFGEYAVNPRDADDLVTTAIGPTLVSLDFTPTFPEPDQDVAVTVTAYDDQPGLAVDLYISIDGGAYSATAMTDNGDSTYSGTITGQPEGTEVSFYAYLTDSDNNTVSSDTFSVTFTAAGQITAIYDIQYTTDPSGDSPLNGQVVTISGIVTAEFWGSSGNKYLFVQDAEGPWNGILVYESGGWDNFDFNSPAGVVHSVAEGDSVTLTGTVDEYYGMTEIGNVTEFNIIGPATAPIAPSDVTPGQIMTGGSDAEAYEGCLVRVSDVTVDDPDLGYGEWSVTDGTNSVRVDDKWDYYYWPEQGQALAEVVGCLDYSFSNTKIQPRLARDVVEAGAVRIQRIQQVLYSDLLKAGEDAVSDTSYMRGDTVTVEGIVIMPTGLSFAGAGVKFIFQDEHGGPWSAILSYDPDSTAFPVLYEGDKIVATGFISEYSTGPSNMTELFITQPIDIVDVGLTEPTVPDVLTGDLRWPPTAEQWGTVMVRVNDAVVIENDLPYGEWSVDDGSGKVNVDDDSDSISVWQEENGRPPVGTYISSIRGWVYHHFGSYSDSTAYKLEPLYVSDIVFGAGPPNITNVSRDPCVPAPGDEVTVTADITDNSTIATAEIYYTFDGTTYQSAAMTSADGVTWSGVIPATNSDGTVVSYYVQATDDGVDQDQPKTSTYPYDTELDQLGYATKSAGLTIADIQYTPWASGNSLYDGCEVTVTGIITGDSTQYYESWYGAYALQSAAEPWSGIIFDGWDDFPLFRGDEVTITGTVEEFDPEWHFKYDNNTKLINVSAVSVLSSGNSMDAIPVSTADLAQDAEEVESYEGVLVTLSNVTVTSVNQYDWSVADASGVECLIDDDMADMAADEFMSSLTVGTTLESVTGIFNFSFGTYKVEIRDLVDLGQVGVADEVQPLPHKYALYQNYPNPFNPETRIRFELASQERVKLVIYDLLGHKVRTLTDATYDVGYHVLNWDGRNDRNEPVSTGVYIYRIKAGKFIAHKKMILLR